MPNNVSNTLKIRCQDKVTTDYVKMALFNEDDAKNLTFTMERLLPLSLLCEKEADWEITWTRAIWGTKWDVYEVEIEEISDNFISIFYRTAWSPNYRYIDSLIHYLDIKCGKRIISLEHWYFSYEGDFAGELKWTPGSEPVHNHYDLLEYFRLYNQEAYKQLLADMKEYEDSKKDDI